MGGREGGRERERKRDREGGRGRERGREREREREGEREGGYSILYFINIIEYNTTLFEHYILEKEIKEKMKERETEKEIHT